MTRKIKRGGKVWINVFPDKPVTKKPAETRMGSGKGSPEGWVAVVKPGRVMFELAGVSEPLAREAIRLAAHKLPREIQVRAARGLRATMKASEIRDLDDERTRQARRRAAQRALRPALRQRDRRTRRHRGLGRAKRDLARALTVARERRPPPTATATS